MSLRCRGPAGVFSLTGLEAGQSVLSLCEVISSKSGIALQNLEILSDFPPKPLQIKDASTTSLTQAGIILGDSLTIRHSNSPSISCDTESSQPLKSDQAVRISDSRSDHKDGNFGQVALVSQMPTSMATSDKSQKHSQPASTSETLQPVKENGRKLQIPIHASSVAQPSERQNEEDAELAQALALSLKETSVHSTLEEQQISRIDHGSNSATPSTHSGSGAPVEVAVGDSTFLARRIIDADNSCLFNAVGYVMERSRKLSKSLRSVIANAVHADPETYSEAFLGKTNAAYCEWIQQSQKWGGAIELSILSRHFQREIAAYDIHTQRMDLYGEGEGYSERAMLLYDGLHYDALAVSVFKEAPEDLDITIFETCSSDLPAIMEAAAQLVRKAHEARQFTDTGTFTLRCGICQVGLKGQKEAIEHATKTGHQNFQEY